MQVKLFLSLSVLALFGGAATAYGKLYPRDGIPQGDCLEMACPSGICEEEETTLKGECCPVKEQLPKENEKCTECGCAEGYDCTDGTCVKPCPEPTKTSCTIATDKLDAKGCIILQKISCSEDTPICNSKTGQCVGCEVNGDCTGRQYCDPQKNGCCACPTDLPKAGQPCSDTCGCANGLECVQTGSKLCGYTGVCQNVCETNDDCKRNEYCAFEQYTGQCEKGPGQCRPNNVLGQTFASSDFGPFYSSGETMTWWSAENWCLSHGRNLTDVYPSLSCYYGNSLLNNLGGNDYGHCCKLGTEDCWDKKNNMSSNMIKLRNSLGKYGCYWTDYHSSCHAYTIGLEANQIWNTPLTGKYSLSSKNYMHALCQ